MQALEFSTEVKNGNTIQLPEKFAALLKGGKKVKIIILYEENEKDWELLTAQQFINGYAEEDSIYDKL
ncbi:MAG: hypothetical protein H6577_16595 [Lewinellaceae bacterium]|nr:hypothetical protein [Saprospiraceae bacterium]MCB9339744.1 hypothetical protein [Lewinellaceae bacterium]